MKNVLSFSLVLLFCFSSNAKKKTEEWSCTLKSKETKEDLSLKFKIGTDRILVQSKDFYTLKNETEFLKFKEEKLNYKVHSWYANAQPSSSDQRVFLIYLSKSESGALEIYMHRLFYDENQIQTDDTKGVCSLK